IDCAAAILRCREATVTATIRAQSSVVTQSRRAQHPQIGKNHYLAQLIAPESITARFCGIPERLSLAY
ncbi:TPA: hypothetical protein ACILOY_005190, partial [Escherichia coli]